jgi:SAM-dependent methyltransferase
MRTESSMTEGHLPHWALSVLQCPRTGDRLRVEGCRLLDVHNREAARIDDHVIRFPLSSPDDSIAFYRSIGGPHFFERSSTPFAMSSLDTPIYHERLDEVLPADPESIIVDVGGGDGRHAIHCLRRGYRRVVVIDAVADALARFRSRLAEQHSHWLDSLLLVEADIRSLPIRTSRAQCVLAIESLCYLNEDYEVGLKQCVRLLAPSGRIIISDRDYEGGLVLQLLYHDVGAMLDAADTRSLRDGHGDSLVRSRIFAQSELVDICRANGLEVFSVSGISLLPLLCGYLNGRDLLSTHDLARLPDIIRVLAALGKVGTLRRCHVVIAGLPQGKTPKGREALDLAH